MKIKITALLLLLIISFSLASCGQTVAPSGGNEGIVGGNTGNDPGTDPDKPDDKPADGGNDDEEIVFKASLMLGGNIYIPDATEGEGSIQIRWSDGRTAHTSTIGADGVATAEGLDGDYSLSVIGVPDGYTYNPNIYKATNESPEVIIDLLKITKTKGLGTGLYKCIEIARTGVYRATINSSGTEENPTVVYYEFTPPKSGVYSIESMVDISAEMYNPLVDIYTGSSQYKLFNERRDDGGVSGSYTTNFKNTVMISADEVGGCFTFGIILLGKDAVYPATVDFEIKYLGDYQREDVISELMYPSFIPNYQKLDSNNNLVFDSERFDDWYQDYAAYLAESNDKYGGVNYTDAAVIIDGKRVFDEDFYRLNPDDGYYHVYDTVKYAEYGGWGPILYADISQPGIFMGDPFNQVEYNGNKALTVAEGTLNYKLFIEGYNELIISHGDSGPYLCNSDCPCYTSGKNGGSCAIEDNCTKCKSSCRHLPREYKYQRGYADIAVGGRCPVTEELKIFLQLYSESERLFSDGNGWAEQYSPRYDAYEDSQWLFACGYYTN